MTRCLVIAVAAGTFSFANSGFAEPAEKPAITANPDRATTPTIGSSDAGAKGSGKGGNMGNTGASSSTGGSLSASDKQFMMTAAKDGMKEVHMGQMAVQQGQSAEVKKLGNMIVGDHTKANNQLMEIASRHGVKPDLRHKMDKMSKKEMSNFDQAWLGMMVTDHQKDIALYQQQAQQGTDPDLKAFAKKTLPVLQKHLKGVQAAQKKMGGTTTAGGTTEGATAKTGR